jgi:hypothetical protein
LRFTKWDNAVQNPPVSNTANLFAQAASAGRGKLSDTELQSLLADLQIGFADRAVPADAVDIRISLNSTREFGMVISAGLGGLEAELGEGNFRRDRASVYAAAELTDAEDFLGLFRRTLAYQKLVAVARRNGSQPPDVPLKACFERLLELTKAFAPGKADAPCVLRSLELNPAQVGEDVMVRATQRLQ